MSFVWDKATLTQNKPQGQTNSGSFNNNMYSNPQMGQYGGPPHGWGNQNSAMYGYQQGFAPPESAWVGDAPGHIGQGYSYNPQTGQGGWQNTAGGLQIGGSNPYGSGAVAWTDPITGMKSINPKALMGAFGMDGGGYQMTDFSGGNITAPGAYGGGDWSRPSELSAAEVIESYRPTMEANIDQGFAEAGNRLGASGFAMSTPYATALGDVERLARAQMNQRGLEYTHDASKFDRTQDLQRQMAQNAELFGGWQQSGNWDMRAQEGNANNAMQQWMMQNQMGMQNNQNQYQMLAALLGGMF